MLRKIRIILAALFFVGINLLFLDITGVLHSYLAWMSHLQLLPAILSGSLLIMLLLLLLTLLFGRVYCSVICPLGVMQDCFSWFGGKVKKNRFHYTKAHNVLRYIVMGIFVLLMVLGLNSVAIILAPYSAYIQDKEPLCLWFRAIYMGFGGSIVGCSIGDTAYLAVLFRSDGQLFPVDSE